MVVRGGRRLELAEVIRRRSEEVLTMYNDLGYKGGTFEPGAQSENVMFFVETLMEKYQEGRECFARKLGGKPT